MEIELENPIGVLGMVVLGIFLMAFGGAACVTWLFIRSIWKWMWNE